MRWPQLTTLLYFLFAVMVGVPFSAFSDEPPYPQWETMYPMEGDIGNNILHIECSLMEPKTPTCDLQQLLFLKPDPHSIDHLDEMTSLLMDMCPEMESEPGFSWHDPETERNITEAQSGPEGIEDVLSFCRARSQVERLAVMRRMVESGNEKLGKTCYLRFLRVRREVYSWKESSSQWRNVKDASECGVRISTLRSTDDSGGWWEYVEQMTITNPQGKLQLPTADITCAEYEQDYGGGETLIWAARGRPITPNCQIITQEWNLD